MNEQIIKTNQGNNFNFTLSDKTQILIGRVFDIILNDKHPKFKELGEWDSLGTIFFNEANKFSNSQEIENLPYAKPLNANKKHYPLKNELVYIIAFQSIESQNNISVTQYYYKDIINVWGNPNHNALPLNNNLDEKINKNYTQNGQGVTQQNKQTTTNIDLGNDFIEKSNIKPLLPKAGDYIIESRFGSSIRFGSDEAGNPITIIRNGQNQNQKDNTWVPNKENINDDDSLIHFGSGSEVPIEVSSNNLKSFNITLASKTYSNNKVTSQPQVTESFSEEKIQKQTNTYITGSKVPKLSITSSLPNFTGSQDDFFVPDDSFDESSDEVTYNGGKMSFIKGFENKNNIQLSNSPTTNFSATNTKGSGKISDEDIDIYAKPILDMIATAEGTYQYGSKNGYDIIFSGKIIDGWNDDYLKGHPGVYVKFGNTSSSAAGRYQIKENVWKSYSLNSAFNKNNQDLTAYRLLTLKRRIDNSLFKNIYDNSSKSVYENVYFLNLLDIISYEWASISNSKGEFRYSGQGTTKPEKAYFLYKQALKQYGL